MKLHWSLGSYGVSLDEICFLHGDQIPMFEDINIRPKYEYFPEEHAKVCEMVSHYDNQEHIWSGVLIITEIDPEEGEDESHAHLEYVHADAIKSYKNRDLDDYSWDSDDSQIDVDRNYQHNGHDDEESFEYCKRHFTGFHAKDGRSFLCGDMRVGMQAGGGDLRVPLLGP